MSDGGREPTFAVRAHPKAYFFSKPLSLLHLDPHKRHAVELQKGNRGTAVEQKRPLSVRSEESRGAFRSEPGRTAWESKLL